MRPSGSPEALERRRFRAISLLKEGLQPVEVAKKLKLIVEVSVVGKLLSGNRAPRPSRLNILLAALQSLIKKPKKVWRNDFSKEPKRLVFILIFGHAPESLN